jgi:hypothetical protein
LENILPQEEILRLHEPAKMAKKRKRINSNIQRWQMLNRFVQFVQNLAMQEKR